MWSNCKFKSIPERPHSTVINKCSNSRTILALPPKQTLGKVPQQLLNRILSRWFPAPKHSHEPSFNCSFALSWSIYQHFQLSHWKLDAALCMFCFRGLFIFVTFPELFVLSTLRGRILPSQTHYIRFQHRLLSEQLWATWWHGTFKVSSSYTGAKFKQITAVVWRLQWEEATVPKAEL